MEPFILFVCFILFITFPLWFRVLIIFIREKKQHWFRYKPTQVDFIDINSVLASHLDYYKRLPEQDRKVFVERTINFLKSKKFISGSKGFYISFKMKVIISGIAIMLTFGLDRFMLNYLIEIVVFPKSFEHKKTKMKFKGLTSKAGVLAVSWKDIEYGVRKPDDGYNLGLHEMAHALDIQWEREFKDYGYYSQKSIFFDKWALTHYTNNLSAYLDQTVDGAIRKYGYANEHEFFAVVVELFFERPDDLYTHHPKTYKWLVELLNQDLRGDKD